MAIGITLFKSNVAKRKLELHLLERLFALKVMARTQETKIRLLFFYVSNIGAEEGSFNESKNI